MGPGMQLPAKSMGTSASGLCMLEDGPRDWHVMHGGKAILMGDEGELLVVGCEDVISKMIFSELMICRLLV